MATKKTGQTALATEGSASTTTGTGLALVQHDELAEALGDDAGLLDTDGLEELDASDRKLAALVFNFKGVDQNDEPIPANRFFNTVDETIKPKARLALLVLHKSHAWTEYDSAEGRNKVKCRSWDRSTGETDEGTIRACKGCPDFQWRTDPQTKKRTRRCGEVHNVVAVDLDTAQPVILRLKKTHLRPWLAYLNKHFIGKRIVAGKHLNLPLFAVETTISLEMVKGSGATPYAVPVFERGAVLPHDQLLFMHESAKAFRETYLDKVREVAEGAPDDDASDARGEGDASFDPKEFQDDAPAGAAPAEGDANRF